MHWVVARSPSHKTQITTQQEKKKARAERFGIATATTLAVAGAGVKTGAAGGAAGSEKKEKGPSIGALPIDEEEEARRRARAARFGLQDPKLEVRCDNRHVEGGMDLYRCFIYVYMMMV